MRQCIKCKDKFPLEAFYGEKRTCKNCLFGYLRDWNGRTGPVVNTPCSTCGVRVKNPLLHARRYHGGAQTAATPVSEEALQMNRRLLELQTEDDRKWAWKKLEPSLYFIQAGGVGRPVKIGITVNLLNRLSHFQASCPDPFEVLFVGPGTREEELQLNEKLQTHRLHGEWFRAHEDVLCEILTRRAV